MKNNSNIVTFFPLGGMDENDKPCYVLRINKQYFLFNLGISIPYFENLGIKKVLPYIDWIKKNHKLINGIFIGNATYHNIGGLQYCYPFIKDIPIYTSKVNALIINTLFNKKCMEKHYPSFEKFNIKVLAPLKPISLDKTKVVPFRVISSLPETLGFVIMHDKSNIIYIDQFVINNTVFNAFNSDINKLPFLTYPNANFLLINNVGNVHKNLGFSAPSFETESFYKEILNNRKTNRLLVACNYSDIYTLLVLAKIAQERQIPFVIYSPMFAHVYNEILKNNYFDLAKLPLLPISNINKVKNGIVAILAPFDCLLQKMAAVAKNEDDILVLKKSDTVVLGFKSAAGFERSESELLDQYARLDVQTYSLPKNYISLEASQEDHKYLVSMLRPKYVIPTLGIYYQMIEYGNCLQQIGFKRENILNLYNGEVANFDNNTLRDIKQIEINPIYVSSNGIMNEGYNIFKERQIMAENGVVFCSIKLDEQKGQLESKDYEFIDYAVTVENEDSKLIWQNIKTQTFLIANKMLIDQKAFDIKNFKEGIKKFIMREVEKNLSKHPIVIVSIN